MGKCNIDWLLPSYSLLVIKPEPSHMPSPGIEQTFDAWDNANQLSHMGQGKMPNIFNLGPPWIPSYSPPTHLPHPHV